MGGDIALTDDQKSIVKRCVALRDGDDRAQGGPDNTVDWQPLKFDSPFVKMHMRFDEEANKKAKRSIAIGKAEAEIDASAAEVSAWLWDLCSNERMRMSKEDGNPARLVVSRNGFNDMVFATVKSMPLFISDREFVVQYVLSKDLETGAILTACMSMDAQEDYGKKLSKVEGLTTALFTAMQVAPNRCKLTLVQNFDAGGNVPVWLVNRNIPRTLSVIEEARHLFDRSDEIDEEERKKAALLMEWDAVVGRAKEVRRRAWLSGRR